MNFLAYEEIDGFFETYKEVFTLDDLYKYLKSRKIKCTKNELYDRIKHSDNVFKLVDGEFLTRNGAFTDRWFSFKPTVEEVQKGYFMLGHRCMPFIRPFINPDSYQVREKGKQITPEAITFKMNTVLDVYALFGEGYLFQYLSSDRVNIDEDYELNPYSLPNEIKITAWPLKAISKNKDFTYGDRILCRVSDWDNNVIEMKYVPENKKKLRITYDDLDREEWYRKVEEKLLLNFKKQGPTDSIEQQLAFLFLENEHELCKESCGSIEELLTTSNKIAVRPYGVETRIWNINKNVPYCGSWNDDVEDIIQQQITSVLMPTFSVIMDVFLESTIYLELNGKKFQSADDFFKQVFPFYTIELDSTERETTLLNIEKRRDILKKNYNEFLDYPIVEIRKSILEIFTKTLSLLARLGTSGIECRFIPQQELIILEQVFTNSISLIEHIANPFLRAQIINDDSSTTIKGMFETFEEVSITLENFLTTNQYKGFEIIDTDDKE